ncbi:MAG: SGNH/GDSL hydrolase family protein [Salinivirgaceae bacterium]|jgi:hypothetical protein|nr:SGNH/GDSL hydrolase family protein [Salinivirgaceae bacterium]
MKNLGILLLLSIAISSCHKEVFIDYKHPQISYSGRIDSLNGEGVDLWRSGTSVKVNFEGKNLSVLLKDNNGDNYYNVIVDDNKPFILRPDTIKQYYKLVKDLAEGEHAVEIFKRTEWDRGKTTFYGFSFNEEGKILEKEVPKKRKIEFYGNSITAGYAVEDFSGNDSPDSIFTNNYLSYSTLTAKHFNAEYSCICKSGIGIMVSWVPLIMPEIYNRLNPTDANSKWDFSLFTPDVVVINLLQNDSWLVNMTEHDEFKASFGDTAPRDAFIVNAYASFVSSIRTEYPQANIICALGSMDATREGSIWPNYVQQAVDKLNDDKILTHFMPYKDSPGHPTIKEQQDMANSLIKFIEKHIDW